MSIAALAALLAATGWSIAQVPLAMERRLNSMLYTLEATELFVQSQHRWPRSWAELDGYSTLETSRLSEGR